MGKKQNYILEYKINILNVIWKMWFTQSHTYMQPVLQKKNMDEIKNNWKCSINNTRRQITLPQSLAAKEALNWEHQKPFDLTSQLKS